MNSIAIVAHGLSDGGSERVAALLANHFCDIGYRVLFVAAFSDQIEYSIREDITYYYAGTNKTNGFSKTLDRARQINAQIKAFKPDTVLSFLTNELFLVTLSHKYYQVFSLRGNPEYYLRGFIKKIICLWSYNRAGRLVFQIEGARDYFSESIRKKSVIIGNPLTSNLPEWKKDNYKKQIITACRLSEVKNVKMLIKGFARFAAERDDYELIICGDGPLKEQLMKLSEELRVSDKVRFLGHVDDVHDLMAESAVFSLTSDSEGVSNAMLEAMAIGVPTVCTDCPPGGAREYIQNGINGLLVPVGDDAELALAFEKLADDPELCKNMSECARKVIERLDPKKVLEKWDEAVSRT